MSTENTKGFLPLRMEPSLTNLTLHKASLTKIDSKSSLFS